MTNNPESIWIAILTCPTYFLLRAYKGKGFKVWGFQIWAQGGFAIPLAFHGDDIVYYFPTYVFIYSVRTWHPDLSFIARLSGRLHYTIILSSSITSVSHSWILSLRKTRMSNEILQILCPAGLDERKKAELRCCLTKLRLMNLCFKMWILRMICFDAASKLETMLLCSYYLQFLGKYCSIPWTVEARYMSCSCS